MGISEVVDDSQLSRALENPSQLKVLYFYSEDTPQCHQMSDVLLELVKSNDYKDVSFFKINAKKSETLSNKMKVRSVPTFIFYMAEEVDRLVGADVPVFVKMLKSQSLKAQSGAVDAEENLDSKLKKLINKVPCMLFMKGNPQMPRCGFSKQVIELLNRHNARYETFDILEDYDVREGLKKYSNWPTYPQLYVKGELIGGLDILKELSAAGELDELLESHLSKDELNDRLKELINQADVMIFMKGSSQEPRCKFSKALMELMNETGVSFDTFDILGDNSVREGLKAYSNWPTYPQVYVKGNLIGGIDILKELKEAGELKSTLEGKES